jgi:4-amino-4-deoxy-L-arabinose transferase-like glycosyltransferase
MTPESSTPGASATEASSAGAPTPPPSSVSSSAPGRARAWSGNTPLALLAVALALIAQAQLGAGRLRDALLLYGAAGALWLFALSADTPTNVDNDSQIAAAASPGRWAWRLFAGVAIAGGLGAWSLWLLNVDQPSLRFWLMYLASLLAVLTAAMWLDRRLARPNSKQATVTFGSDYRPAFETQPADLSRRTVWMGLGLILLLAAALRLFRFHDLPFGVWYDEAVNGLQAMRILGEAGYLPLFVESIHAPAHYLYLVAASIAWLGPTAQAVRAVSVVIGVVSIWAAYFLGRELHGKTMGLVLALLIALSRWHINFSRIGMYNISTPFFELLALAFLLRGLRRGRYTDYALSGLSVGLGLSFYSVFQLFIVVMAHYLFSTAILSGLGRFVRHTWAGLVVFVLAALLVVAPIARYAQIHPDTYFARARQTSLYRAKEPETWLPALGENLRRHLLMFHYQGDRNGRHNLPNEPMLDPFSGALMFLGLLFCLRRAHHPQALLQPVWLLVMLMGGILSLDFEAPQSLRSIGALPAAYLLAVTAIDALRRTWRQEAGARLANWFWAPILILLAATAYSNSYTYFVRQAHNFRSWVEFATPETIVAHRLAALGDDMQPYIVAYYDRHPTLRFLAPNAPPYQVFDTTGYLPIVQPADKGMFIALDTGLLPVFEQLQELYPAANFESVTPPFGGAPVLYLATLSPDDVASIQGATGSYFANHDWAGEPSVRKDAALDFTWPQDAPVPLPFSVEWQGVLRVESYGVYTLTLHAPAHAELFLDEFPVLEGSGVITGARVLAEGNHQLRLRAIGADGKFRLAWQPPDRQAQTIPPWLLYVPPVTANGLQGAYYANGDWSGEPAFLRIDPQLHLYFHVPPLPRPYTVEWTGKLATAVGGEYRFGLKSTDEATLWIDETIVVSNSVRAARAEGIITLTTGLHDVRVRYGDRTNRTQIHLDWTPPGGETQIVPAQAWFPPRGSYKDID